MARRMARGNKVSLAPAALGYLYHGLSITAQNPSRTSSKISLASHFLVGWLAEYFPGLYSRRPDGDVPVDSPLLAQYAGLRGTTFNIHQARGVFRHPSTVEYRRVPFGPSSLSKGLVFRWFLKPFMSISSISDLVFFQSELV